MSRRSNWRYESRAPILAGAVLVVLGLGACRGSSPAPPALVYREDLFIQAPFAQCHASTVVETGAGLVAAWFGGSAEGRPDVGIWLSRRTGERWSTPVQVAKGTSAEGAAEPCWNPVLFRPSRGPLFLFYKVGSSPSTWRGYLIRSKDDGRTWTEPEPLPAGIIGPVKDHPIELADGSILCGSSTEDAGWRVHFEKTKDQGRTWEKTTPINGGEKPGLIQPTLLKTGDGRITALMRSDAGRIFSVKSEDAGATWSSPEPTVFPNPNAGIDAATLRDGRHVLVYNPVTEGRGILAVAVSADAKSWQRVRTLEEEKGAEFSYPAVIQTHDGLVHVTYTWKRQTIRHVVLDPDSFPALPTGASKPPGNREFCVLETNLGRLAFELFDEDAPKTVAQFKSLVEKGFYDGKDFYRVVRGHVIQAGDGGAPPLPPEFNTRPHLFGTLGLGRIGDEWSGDSEIYVCVAPRPHLDGRYAVFGQLIEGQGVLERIAAVPVKEIWEGKMAMHKPLTPVVIIRASIKRR